MSDIEKCINGCPRKLLCRRWTAPSGDRQAIRDMAPDPSTGLCNDYLPNAVGAVELPTIKGE